MVRSLRQDIISRVQNRFLMNILFISENYYPQTSGVPVVVKYLAEGLYNRGHHVSVATQSHGNPNKNETIAGVSIYRFDIYKNIFKRPSGNTRSYIDFVKEYPADVVIIECTQCVTTDLLLPYLKEIKGRKYFHVHGISGLTPGRRLFTFKSDLKHTIGNTYNWILGEYYFKYELKRAIPYFEATICLSEVDDGIDYLEKYSRYNYILENAADDMFFDSNFCARNILEKYVQLENKKFMVSCANYSYIKNQLGIIRQYYMSESSKRMSLICLGSQANDYYNKCLLLVKEMEVKYGHRDVNLLCGVERIDIPAILNKAYLYLVGSFWEQYSISIIEAMSQGIPFVSTNVGNTRLLPGGVVIDSIDKMHDSIDTFLFNEYRYKKLSDEGKKYAYNNCRISVAVDKLEKLICETL